MIKKYKFAMRRNLKHKQKQWKSLQNKDDGEEKTKIDLVFDVIRTPIKIEQKRWK